MLLANFQTLIVFHQGSLGDRLQRLFVFCRVFCRQGAGVMAAEARVMAAEARIVYGLIVF
jgi:hypothetical protein